MNKRYCLLSVPFYLFAALCVAVYLFAEIRPGYVLMPANRILLLGACCIGAFVGSRVLCKSPAIDKSKVMKRTFLLFFAAYLLLILTFTLFDPAFGRDRQVRFVFSDETLLKNSLENALNIIPFRTIYKYISALFTHRISFRAIVINLLGNFVAFMPLGLFLPMFFRKCEKLIFFLLTTSLIVLCIETLQFLFVIGFCDIDDLILNVFGACIAYFVLKMKPVGKLIDKLALRNR